MHRWLILLPLSLAACSGAPASPASSTITLSGTVTATNGGQPLAGAVIDVAGKQVVTNSRGQFALETPTGRLQLMISGAGLVPRVQSVTAGSVTTDAITQGNGFDLAFYRQFARNGFEAPTSLEPLRRWTTAPVFTLQTTDDQGRSVPADTQAVVQAAITETVPMLTGGQFTASFGAGGVAVRFVTDQTPGCSSATIGPQVGAYLNVDLACSPVTLTRIADSARHETGHVLGFWHTPGDSHHDLMSGLGSVPSARERYHAAIAYHRQPGNRDPDSE